MQSSIAGISVSRETIERLSALQALVVKWTERINLISSASVPDAWQRHIVDSAQLFTFRQASTQKWLDLGSGGGFPALVLASMAIELAPEVSFMLVESDQRKVTFLRAAIREMNLPARAISSRIEELEPQAADVISARALAPLDRLLPMMYRHGHAATTYVVPKGAQLQRELESVKGRWRFQSREEPSITNSEGRILVMERLVPSDE